MPEILSVGRYEDLVVDTADGLRFAQRLCIFDNDLIPNSLIYPI
jgi:salicylate 5-hydroxylase small subunit